MTLRRWPVNVAVAIGELIVIVSAYSIPYYFTEVGLSVACAGKGGRWAKPYPKPAVHPQNSASLLEPQLAIPNHDQLRIHRAMVLLLNYANYESVIEPKVSPTTSMPTVTCKSQNYGPPLRTLIVASAETTSRENPHAHFKKLVDTIINHTARQEKNEDRGPTTIIKGQRSKNDE